MVKDINLVLRIFVTKISLVVSVGFAFTNYSGYEGLLATVCAVILNGTVKRPVSVFASTSQITAIRKSNAGYVYS